MLQTSELRQHVVLKNQYALVLALPLYLEGYFLFELIVVSLVNVGVGSLPKLWADAKAVRDAKGVLVPLDVLDLTTRWDLWLLDRHVLDLVSKEVPGHWVSLNKRLVSLIDYHVLRIILQER